MSQSHSSQTGWTSVLTWAPRVLKPGERQCSLGQHVYSSRVNVFPATNAAAPEGAWKTRSPPGQSSRCVVTATCWNCWRHVHVFSLIIFLGFLGVSDGKEFACNAGDSNSIPGLGRSPGGGNDNPLQDSYLGNPMDGGTGRATVHGVAKSWTQLSDQHFHFIILIVIKFIFQ